MDAAQSEATTTSADLQTLMAQFIQAQEAKFEQLREQLKNEYDDKIAQLERQVCELTQDCCKCDCSRQLAAVVDNVATLETTVSSMDTKLLGLVQDVDAKICRVQAQAEAVENDVKAQIKSVKMHSRTIMEYLLRTPTSPLSLLKEPTRGRWMCPNTPTPMLYRNGVWKAAVYKNGVWKEAASIPSCCSSSASQDSEVEASGVSQHSTDPTARFARGNGLREGVIVFG